MTCCTVILRRPQGVRYFPCTSFEEAASWWVLMSVMYGEQYVEAWPDVYIGENND